MPEETIKPVTKKKRKSEREENGFKVKKRRKLGSATAEERHDLCQERQRSDPSATKIEDSALSQRAEDQLSSRTTPSDTSPNRPRKAKASRKQKRTDRDAMPDEPVNSGTDATEVGPQKCDEHDEDWMRPLSCPDPAADESLPAQSRRALSYAYERCRGSEVWKFNKARQNWLLRNAWSEQAVPESYILLVTKYLVNIRGGAREKVIAECISRLSTLELEPPRLRGTQPSCDSAEVGSMISQQPNASRALSILQALNKNS